MWVIYTRGLAEAEHPAQPYTPAMAARLTDHVWSLFELLSYKVAPSPWMEPKRRRRPRKEALCTTS